MNPLGGRGAAWTRPCASLRLAPLPPPVGGSGGGSARGRMLRGFLGAGMGAAAGAGMCRLGLAAGGPPPLVAAAGAGLPARRYGEFGSPERRATDVLLVANVLLYGLQMLSGQLITAWGIKHNALIAAGQWWRLLTPAFLHADVIHLVVNSASLNNLGPLVEATAGRPRYLLMYLAGAVASTAASFAFSPAMSLGASGAIFGLGGALAVYFLRNRELYGKASDRMLRGLQQSLVMNVVYGLMNPRIDNWGHMGGMVGGALAAALLGPQLRVGSVPGQRGRFLVDTAPLPWLRSPPRKLSK